MRVVQRSDSGWVFCVDGLPSCSVIIQLVDRDVSAKSFRMTDLPKQSLSKNSDANSSTVFQRLSGAVFFAIASVVPCKSGRLVVYMVAGAADFRYHPVETRRGAL